MTRFALILIAATSLAAGARLDLFHVSPEQERRNLIEWQRMAETERDALRRTWRRISALEGDERERSQRHMATVSRLLGRHLRRTGEPLGHDDLLRLLRDYPAFLDAFLDRQGLPEGPLRDRLEGRTQRLVLSFLKGLAEQGRLDAPLEVAEQMRETRRRRGLLGRASRVFGLTEADRTWLADVSDEELVKALRTVYEPKVRAHLEEKGWGQDEIAKVLAYPLRKLERTLDRIERTGR
jgi:hypothetical protein